MAEKNLKMDYDELLQKVGGFGWYQRKVYLFMCIISLSGVFYNVMIVFIAAQPDFWCSVPDAEHLRSDLTQEQWLRLTTTGKQEGNGDFEHDACER